MSDDHGPASAVARLGRGLRTDCDLCHRRCVAGRREGLQRLFGLCIGHEMHGAGALGGQVP